MVFWYYTDCIGKQKIFRSLLAYLNFKMIKLILLLLLIYNSYERRSFTAYEVILEKGKLFLILLDKDCFLTSSINCYKTFAKKEINPREGVSYDLWLDVTVLAWIQKLTESKEFVLIQDFRDNNKQKSLLLTKIFKVDFPSATEISLKLAIFFNGKILSFKSSKRPLEQETFDTDRTSLSELVFDQELHSEELQLSQEIKLTQTLINPNFSLDRSRFSGDDDFRVLPHYEENYFDLYQNFQTAVYHEGVFYQKEKCKGEEVPENPDMKFDELLKNTLSNKDLELVNENFESYGRVAEDTAEETEEQEETEKQTTKEEDEEEEKKEEKQNAVPDGKLLEKRNKKYLFKIVVLIVVAVLVVLVLFVFLVHFFLANKTNQVQRADAVTIKQSKIGSVR